MPNKLEYLLMPRPGDREVIQNYLQEFLEKDKATLIDTYNKAWQLGIVGNHRQGLNYYALHIAFKKVFGPSPFTFEDGCALGLTELIVQDGEGWAYAGERGKENA
ncbi:MAG: hypothetical protein LW630_09400 [Saprospiraceae bacterium]|jgi:hypothetical protein|nr:hypothetical protein [Saprospiraceae bacterium]